MTLATAARESLEDFIEPARPAARRSHQAVVR